MTRRRRSSSGSSGSMRAARSSGEALLGVAACLDAQGKAREAMAAYKDVISRRPGDYVAVAGAVRAGAAACGAERAGARPRILLEEVERNDPYGGLGPEAGMRLEELKTKYPKLFAPAAPLPTASPPAPHRRRPLCRAAEGPGDGSARCAGRFAGDERLRRRRLRRPSETDHHRHRLRRAGHRHLLCRGGPPGDLRGQRRGQGQVLQGGGIPIYEPGLEELVQEEHGGRPAELHRPAPPKGWRSPTSSSSPCPRRRCRTARWT